MFCLNFKILLLLALLFTVCFTQRGGGSRSSSRSRSSSSSRSRSSGSGFFGTRRSRSRRGSGSIFSWFSSDDDNQTLN